jgi:hypothetical protein
MGLAGRVLVIWAVAVPALALATSGGMTATAAVTRPSFFAAGPAAASPFAESYRVRYSNGHQVPYSKIFAQAPVTGLSPGWTATQAPLPHGGKTAGLGSIVCTSASACVADGGYGATPSQDHGLLLTKSGSSWTSIQAPLPSGAAANPMAELGDIVCPAASTCVVGGSYLTSAGTYEPVILTGYGSSWTPVQAPLPAGAKPADGVSLDMNACPAATTCIATGSYTDSAGNQQAMLLTGYGTSWKAIKVPLPPGASPDPYTTIDGLACATPSTCVAAGVYNGTSGNQLGLLLTGSGTTWKAIKAPVPPATTAGSLLSDVTCPTATACVAVGAYNVNSPTPHGLVVTGSGTAWQATSAPLPPGAKNGLILNWVACPSTSKCVATGTDGEGTQSGLLTGYGSTWTAVDTPLPAGADASIPANYLYQVACPTASVCITFGQYADKAGNGHIMKVTGSGSSWKATQAPLPANAIAVPWDTQGAIGPPVADSVSCPSVSDCYAVGAYADTADLAQGLLLTGPAN